jgi:hypothetical protein
VAGSPLHGVINFSGCRLLRMLCGVLLQFSPTLKEFGLIFCVMVGFTTVEHAVWRSKCV